MAQHTLTCPLDCPEACGILLETDERGAFKSLRGNPQHPWSKGHLCGKTALYGEVITSSERLLQPLVRGASGELEPSTWEAAMARIAERVKPLDGSRILALGYAGNMGLASRMFPMRAMNALGAVETDGGICDNTASAAYEMVLGRIIGPRLQDMEEADFLILWGCNAARTLQHSLPRIKQLCKSGVPVFAVDIWRTETLRTIERWGGRSIVLETGSDAALALGLCRLAYEQGRVDRTAVARDCVGAQEFEAHVNAAHGMDWVSATTGLEPSAVQELAQALFAAKRPFIKAGIGWTRRRNGGMSMRALLSLSAILGVADRTHFESGDHFGLSDDLLAGAELRPADRPREIIRHVDVGRELCAGRFDAVFVWSHNPALTLPDSKRVHAGFKRDEVFLVVHEQFLTETAAMADVVLPAVVFAEHSDVYKSYGHRVLHFSRKALAAPTGPCAGEGPRSNVHTFAAIAQALDLPEAACMSDEQRLCRELLEASKERFSPEERRRLEAHEPVELAPLEYPDRGTPSGRIELVSAAAEQLGQARCATYVPDDGAGGRGSYHLISAPSVHTHNSTFSHSARHMQRCGSPTVHVAPRDARHLGVANGDALRLSNEQGALTLTVACDDNLPTGSVRIDGLPRGLDTPEGIGVNVLVPSVVSDVGDGMVLYSTRVDLERVS